MIKRPTLFLCLIFFLCLSSYAQVQVPFTPRYSESITGDVTMIANNMLSRHPTNDYNGGENNHVFDDNVYVDIDTDDTTFNSSSATFTNPNVNVECLSIYKAFLYWAAADQELENGEDSQPNWDFDEFTEGAIHILVTNLISVLKILQLPFRLYQMFMDNIKLQTLKQKQVILQVTTEIIPEFLEDGKLFLFMKVQS